MSIKLPFLKAAAVTKSDSTVLAKTRGLYIGGAGNVAVIMADDASAVTLVGLAVGVVHELSVTKVMSTNTTATNIVALY